MHVSVAEQSIRRAVAHGREAQRVSINATVLAIRCPFLKNATELPATG